MRMNERSLSSPRLLIVDDESDLRLFLQDFLMEEGYRVDISATLDEALALIDAHVYHLIVTDLLMHSTAAPLRSALAIYTRAHPTPVIALTGWNLSAAEVARAGLTRLIAKPFDLTEFLAAIAASVETRLSAEQQRQAETLRRYCDAFNAGDLGASLATCVDGVRLYPSDKSLGEPAPVIAGHDACLTYLEGLRRARPDLRLEDYVIYPHPKGLALRYLMSWSTPETPNGRASVAGALAVQFNSERISQISMRTRGPWDALPPPTDTLPDEQDCTD
jgi:CheY-like chemotaxis protein